MNEVSTKKSEVWAVRYLTGCLIDTSEQLSLVCYIKVNNILLGFWQLLFAETGLLQFADHLKPGKTNLKTLKSCFILSCTLKSATIGGCCLKHVIKRHFFANCTSIII